MELILSSNRRRRARVSAEVVAEEDGVDKLKVMAWLGLKPGFTRHSAERLRSISPAPTRRTKAVATSMAAKISCRRCCAPLEPRPQEIFVAIEVATALVLLVGAG